MKTCIREADAQDNLYILSRKIWLLCSDFEELKKLLKAGDLQTHKLFTTEYLAGQFAYYASTARDEVNKRVFKNELKFLRELGVVFDEDQAMQFSIHFKGMLDNENAVLKWF
jgi:hypothetical protein